MNLLQWLADQPHAWIGKNPRDGGYSCIVRLPDNRDWFQRTFNSLLPLEGMGDTPEEAIEHVIRLIELVK